MQVSQINDHVTHAVIGGAKAINFTVSDDAELMNVLSKALYTDQQLAVIRETLCNAWDAHIEAGITDTPFFIKLNREELIIRDYGPGIPFDMIGSVYGTYGGSTKKMNGNVTGGFGLGCKSPFAYTDHFEVTSWNQGTMTVYNMSKSSAEVQGKPGIIPILSVPTTETGLQVRIKLKDSFHQGRFEKLIRRIAENGEMNCILNDNLLEKLPFDKVVHNFLVTDKQLIETNHKILLRYGHVIYPIEKDDAFSDQFNTIQKILERMPHKVRGYGRINDTFKIVFQALPNTVSITPSREALSMQESTIKTITGLLNDFIAIAEARLEKGCFDLLETSINNVWLNSAPKTLFETKNKIPNLPKDDNPQKIITDFDQFIVRYASYLYPNYKNFRTIDYLKRVQSLIDARFGDYKLFEKYKKYIEEVEKGSDKILSSDDWFKENVLNPLSSALLAHPELNPDKLFFYCMDPKYPYREEKKVISQKALYDKGIFEYFPFLRKIVILTHNRLDFETRASKFPIMKNWLGTVEDSFLYIVSRVPKKIEVTREFFQKQGYFVLDLTVVQPWEDKEVIVPIRKEYVTRPKRKGIPTLESCLVPNTTLIDFKLTIEEKERLTDTPEFVLKINPKSEDHWFPETSTPISHSIIKKWGKVGGFVVNSNQEAKYTAMGASLYEDFILDKIFNEFSTNSRIIDSMPFMFEHSKVINETRWGNTRIYVREIEFMKAVYSDPDLVEYFDLVQNMNEDDRLYWKMWNEFQKENRYGTKGTYNKIKEFINAVNVDQRVIDLFNLIKKSVTLYAFDPTEIMHMMTKTGNYEERPISPKQRLILRDMLLKAIEG